ncbi:hypothetical protein M2324_003871 [Rhodovulum sulfidophilum]|uniref:hypothetical protein n=1 Tax=Rhodovulum sulfidophilum TaxID=35806 RepID=UPI0005A726AE|nr:hypothetical protein [Rhodovulum sulfidophilum]ANB33462.1 hypothetical protein A6W98_04875 [Rhodovulum sulfidophilum DSM 1374]ANB37283.1 hypothetical protein A6024_04725 [Rhodovulum sulfidophilum]MCW2305446.1 hypothetical protein [Rhodovulum sulfidophilum]
MIPDIQNAQPLADRLDRLGNECMYHQGCAFDHLSLIDLRQTPMFRWWFQVRRTTWKLAI